MGLWTLLIRLSQESIPDEEQRIGAPTRPRGSGTTTKNSVGSDAGVTTHSGATCKIHGDLEHDNDQEYDVSLPNGDLDQPATSPGGLRRIFRQISSAIFPSPSNEEEIQAYIPHYRILPILSGVAIPFCILLDIPGVLTINWYMHNGTAIAAMKPNPRLLEVEIALSILCAVLANFCLVVRFLEKRIMTMTILCTLFLSMHDILNLVALATFRAMRGDYAYGQAFWMTFCSTIVSIFTNMTLIIDFIVTSDFQRSGSGLTRKQRALVIIIISLCFYITLGALVNSLLLDLTFVNGLYFTVVTIETIGFGDIAPNSTGSRVFIAFYAILGIINFASIVGYVHGTVLEGLDFGCRRRLLEIQERRRAARTRRRVERRWRHAIIWRLRGQHEHVWIPKNANGRKSPWLILKSCLRHLEWGLRLAARRSTHQSRSQPGMQLNLWALPPCQLEAAALEAGCTLDDLLPEDFYDTYDQGPCQQHTGVKHHTLSSWCMVHPIYRRDTQPLTHHRMSVMAAILTKVGSAIYDSSGNPLGSKLSVPDVLATSNPETAQDSSRSLQTTFMEDGRNYCEDVEDTEKKAYYTRTGLSGLWLLTFWMGGAAIFKATEGWTYGLAVYFCFTSLTTMGYGDLVPATSAGRSFFVVWALIGVPTVTIFVSVISEAYTTRYKNILDRTSFKHAVQQPWECNKVELSQRVQRSGTSTRVNSVLHAREKTDIVRDELTSECVIAEDVTLSVVSSTFEPDQHPQHAERLLEKLSEQILTETGLIQQYMQLINDVNGRSAEVEKFVDGTVWSLVDDIQGRRELAKGTKQDILKDWERGQTLALLRMKRSLKELVNISEQAVAAIRELHPIITPLEQEKEEDGSEISV